MSDDFERPIVTVDIVLMTVHEGELSVALIEREAEPFMGRLALIGGYLHVDEDPDAEAAARRILMAKAGLQGFFFEQLMTFSGRNRDPRGWSVSIAYFALVPHAALTAGTQPALTLRPISSPGDLPFDHDRIVDAARQRLRGKGAYSTMAAHLLPDIFTMSELQATYEVVLGERLDQSAFRRKMNDLGLLEEVAGEKRQTREARRPTTLYRLKSPTSVFDRRI